MSHLRIKSYVTKAVNSGPPSEEISTGTPKWKSITEVGEEVCLRHRRWTQQVYQTHLTNRTICLQRSKTAVPRNQNIPQKFFRKVWCAGRRATGGLQLATAHFGYSKHKNCEYCEYLRLSPNRKRLRAHVVPWPTTLDGRHVILIILDSRVAAKYQHNHCIK